MANATTEKPAAVFRFGSVSAAVYCKQMETKTGDKFEVHNVSLRRSYIGSDRKWASTHSLRGRDLLHAAYALSKCYDFVAEAQGLDDQKQE